MPTGVSSAAEVVADNRELRRTLSVGACPDTLQDVFTGFTLRWLVFYYVIRHSTSHSQPRITFRGPLAATSIALLITC